VDHVAQIYHQVFGQEFAGIKDDFGTFDNEAMIELEELCREHDFDFKSYYKLMDNTKRNLGFNNRTDAIRKTKAILSKEFLLYESSDVNYES
jgi:DNA sulfur modification protein DndC